MQKREVPKRRSPLCLTLGFEAPYAGATQIGSHPSLIDQDLQRFSLQADIVAYGAAINACHPLAPGVYHTHCMGTHSACNKHRIRSSWIF